MCWTPPPRPRAFTLIELLIVVAIIAILAAIAVPNFLEAQVRAKVARVRSDMRTTVTALEAYAVDNSRYPTMRMGVAGNPAYPIRTPDDFVSPPTTTTRTFNQATIPLNLTTPVSYISTTLRDPFKDAGSVRKNTSNTITAGPGSAVPLVVPSDQTTYDFRYDNIQQLTELPGFGFDDLDLKAYGRWRLTSIGPDNEFFGSIGRRVYDPTNGTVSLGDIIYSQASPDGRGGEFISSGSN